MHLVEQHCIKKSDPRYAAIDAAAFASKNLYNQASYHFRQAGERWETHSSRRERIVQHAA